MAHKKISQLTVATLLSSVDVMPIVQGAETKQTTVSLLKDTILAGGIAEILDKDNDTGPHLLKYSQSTASRVAGFNSDKELISLNCTLTSLAYIETVSSNVQDQLNAINTTLSGVSQYYYWKDAVRAATTANIALSGLQTIDGVTLLAGQRVLVKNQTLGEFNGIYIANSGGWARASDFDSDSDKIWSSIVTVMEGTTNADRRFICTNNEGTIFGSDPITFVDAGGTTYLGTSNRITVSGGAIDIAATYAGQTSIVTVGTIGTGVWQGTQIDPAYLDLEAPTRMTGDIAFDRQAQYGTEGSPITGPLTFDNTGARNGVEQLLIHNDATEPGYPASFVCIGGTYANSVNNFYLIRQISSTLHHYSIYQ